jgi:hypothetical protein
MAKEAWRLVLHSLDSEEKYFFVFEKTRLATFVGFCYEIIAFCLAGRFN